MTEPDGPSRPALLAALLAAVAMIGIVLAIAAPRTTPSPPVVMPAVAAPHAAAPACQALLETLPHQLGDYRRADIAQPAPEGAAAWQADDGEAVMLRCGLDRPPDFVVGAPIQVVDAVQWFGAHTNDRATWYTVDRPVYVALTLPPGSGPTPIQQLSKLIGDTIATAPVDPAPAG